MILTALAATFSVSLGTSFLGFLVDSFDSSLVQLNLAVTPADTLAVTPADTLAVTPADTLAVTPADTLAVTPADTLAVTPADTLAVTPAKAWIAARLAARASAAIADLLSFLDLDADQSEMPQGEFEDLLWACTLPDYAKAASDLLARPKPQRGARGRFVKKVRVQPDPGPHQGQVNAEPLAPIPAVFSFFKGLYQPTINILIHITQQFNNTYPLPTQ